MTTDHNALRLMRSAAAQKSALAEAEARCKARGEAWTPPRRRIYELLLAAGAPRTAYELMESYKKGRRHAAPPTVYRALDFLHHHGPGASGRESEGLPGLRCARRSARGSVPDL